MRWLLLATFASVSVATSLRLSFLENGIAFVGSRKMDLDGRTGTVQATADTSSFSASNIQLKLWNFTFPTIYPYFGEQLDPYTVKLVADSSSVGTGSVNVDKENCSATIMLHTHILFFLKDEQIGDVPLPLKLTATNTCIDEGGFITLQASGIHIPRLPSHLAANVFFDLPTNQANFTFKARFDFPQGWPGSRCLVEERQPDKIYFSVGRSKLGIGTALPPFLFDPAIGHHNAGGVGTIGPVQDGKASFRINVSDVYIAPLEIFPSMFNLSINIPIIRVNINLNQALTGSINFCSGQLEMIFNASFVPVSLNETSPALPVVTTLTTETSTGYKHTRNGTRFDQWGDGKVVGVSKVPKSSSVFENLLLSLPTDAITEMPAHFSIGCLGWGKARDEFCKN